MVDFGHIVEALIKHPGTYVVFKQLNRMLIQGGRGREGGLLRKRISEEERIVFMFYWLYLLFYFSLKWFVHSKFVKLPFPLPIKFSQTK